MTPSDPSVHGRQPGDACDACLSRSWLLGRLSGRLDVERSRLADVLALGEEELIVALRAEEDPRLARERREFDPDRERARSARAGLQAVCRCDRRYPDPLRSLAAPPPVLYVAGGLDRFLSLVDGDSVAVVGARAPSDYGREIARSLGGGLAAAGVAVISGMARGIDSAAHEGALAGRGATVAVLPGGADRPYPAGARRLYHRITAAAPAGCAVSELPPGTQPRRWTFKARNRIIAALAALTVVVEAGPRSGSLLTADLARELGRPVGAVPGRVTTEAAAGPNRLLAEGALVVRGVQDVLDHLFGAGVRMAAADRRPALTRRQRTLIECLAGGGGRAAALAQARIEPAEALKLLAELELAGWIRRGPGGAITVVP